MKKKKTPFWGKRLEWLLLLVVFGVLTLVICSMKKTDTSVGHYKVQSLREGWYYFDQQEKIQVTLPVSIKSDQEELTLFYDGLGSQAEGQTITTRGAIYELKIMVADEVLYEYSDVGFPRNAPMKAKLDCCAVLPTDLDGKVLTLNFYGAENGVYQINEVYIGNGCDVSNFHYKNEVATMLMVIVMMFFAVLSFAVAVYLRIVGMKDSRFANVAAFLLIVGIWCATDSSNVQHLTRLSPIICVISFYAFMLFAVPVVCFLKNTKDLSKYRILDWLLIAFFVNAIGQGILNYFDVFEFIEMLIVTHVLMILSVCIAAKLVIKEFLENRTWENRVILWAFMMLSAGGVLAILFYWGLHIPYYDLIFNCGILVFVLLLLSGIIVSITENLQSKTEMLLYKRMAKEDRLTGLQNRLVFEEHLLSLQNTADSFDNVALIFMDLNGLKAVNDQYGHNAGDLLLIATGRCIQNTFGVDGNCYRIGGDEFCAIIENPRRTEREWFERLDHEIQMHNKNSGYHMSIARGMSYLKDEHGVIKNINDWKHEADLKMYENKDRMKTV